MRLLANLLLITAVLTASSITGCGGSGLGAAYNAYKKQVEPALEKEATLWKRLVKLVPAEADDAALKRYYEYLDSTALPFYAQLREDLAALESGHLELEASHTELVSFVEARLEFVHSEIRARAMNERARSRDGGLLALFEQEGVANSETAEYLRLVADTAPDAKLGELNQIVEGFRRKWFEPMQRGEKDPDAVQRRLRTHVLPRIAELRQKRYGDDAASRQLKEVVAAWEVWHSLFAESCTLYSDVIHAKTGSEAAVHRSEQHLADFRAHLKTVREKR